MPAKVEVNYLPWGEILKLGDTMTTPKYQAIFQLYTAIAPRRLKDYSEMIFLKGDYDIDDLDDEYNYLIVDNDNNIQSIIYNKFKTYKIYGQQVRNVESIPESLNEAIKDFIKSDNLQTGEFLFHKRNGKKYESFDTLLGNAFGKSDKRISANILRHAYLTDIYTNRKNLTINMKKSIAIAMGNCIETQNQYVYYENDNACD